MIFFKPIIQNEQLIYFEAIENDEVFGNCKMKLDDLWAEIFELTFSQDKPYLVEGLLRSAFNFACSKNAYMGACTCKNIEQFLEKMNFIKLDGKFVNDIPSILQGGCKKCYKN